MDSEILEYAYRLIGRKDYSEAEIRRKFKSRFPDGTGFFDSVIHKLKDYRYIDDAKFFTQYVRSKAVAGYGPHYIRYKLKDKGIYESKEKIEALINKDFDQFTLMKELVQRKRYSKKKYDPYQIKKKYFDFLLRRGFDTSLIRKVLQEELIDESNIS